MREILEFRNTGLISTQIVIMLIIISTPVYRLVSVLIDLVKAAALTISHSHKGFTTTIKAAATTGLTSGL